MRIFSKYHLRQEHVRKKFIFGQAITVNGNYYISMLTTEAPKLGNLDTRLYRPSYLVLRRKVIEFAEQTPDVGGGTDKIPEIRGPERFHVVIDPMIPAEHVSPPLAIRFSAETAGSRNGTTL